MCVGTSFDTSSFAFDPLGLTKQTNRAIVTLQAALDKISALGSNWGVALQEAQTEIEDKSARLASTLGPALQEIATQSIALMGEQARCSIDEVRPRVKARVENEIHRLKKDGKSAPTPPIVCSVTPNPLDLDHPPFLLDISGSWFDSNKRPTLVILSLKGTSIPVDPKYIQVATQYRMTVQLQSLQAAGLIIRP